MGGWHAFPGGGLNRTDPSEEEAIPFYETGWFAMAVRNGVAILGVLLVLLLAVRPAIKALKARTEPSESEGEDEETVLVKGPDGTYSPRGNTIVGQTPMRRMGRADELIGCLLWLVSDEAASFVTGTVIPVDGGFNAFGGV